MKHMLAEVKKSCLKEEIGSIMMGNEDERWVVSAEVCPQTRSQSHYHKTVVSEGMRKHQLEGSP